MNSQWKTLYGQSPNVFPLNRIGQLFCCCWWKQLWLLPWSVGCGTCIIPCHQGNFAEFGLFTGMQDHYQSYWLVQNKQSIKQIQKAKYFSTWWFSTFFAFSLWFWKKSQTIFWSLYDDSWRVNATLQDNLSK